MLVGNDIVDLEDPSSQPDAIHPRFDARVFTPGERAQLLAARSAHRLRWSLWAAKESAYKVAQKLDPGVRFFPNAFVVRLLSDARAEVDHRIGCFQVWLDGADDWVHALATPLDGAGARPFSGVDRLDSGRLESIRENASARVRDLARAALGSLLSITPFEIQIVAERGIPMARRQGESLPVDLSMSHHGRFVACAWAPDR